jgi:1,6-anhydro-N-acetylmuramate kinase
MVYKIIGLHCGSEEKGFSIGYVELQYQSGKWEYSEFIQSTYEYPSKFVSKISTAKDLHFIDYFNMHKDLGTYFAETVNNFIANNKFEYRVQLIALKGFAVSDNEKFQAEIGNPAYLASGTGINVVADFKTIDTALGGNINFSANDAKKLLPDAAPEIQLALLAVLRWREENNFIAENTGATRNNIGGAVWIGQEA